MATVRQPESQQLLNHLVRLGDAIREAPDGDPYAKIASRFFQLIIYLQAENLVDGDSTWSFRAGE